MFEKFFDFIGEMPNEKIDSVDVFLKNVRGKTFMNGLFRFFKSDEVDKWNGIVTEYFSGYINGIEVICYDWLGRVFALSKYTNTVVFFEPGTGDVYDTDASVENFFDSEVTEYTNECFASEFFRNWYESAKEYQLKSNECAGYIVPLFLNGMDSVDNLEVCDMEVHWEMMKIAYGLGNGEVQIEE